jgi:hypothetical protein
MCEFPECSVIVQIDRIENWARFCRDRWHPKTCGSIEKQYRPPPIETEDEDARRRPRIPVDSLDAVIVEKAWRRLHLKSRLILKWAYVYPVHPRIAERKARIDRGTYDARREAALLEIFGILARRG